MKRKYLLMAAFLLSILLNVLLSVNLYRDIQNTGGRYKQNINLLIFDLQEAHDMYTDMKQKNELDNVYINVSATKFSMYARNNDLGDFKVTNFELISSLADTIELLTAPDNRPQIDSILSQVDSLAKKAKDVKSQVNGESNLKWYFALN